jgi:uncharacterized cupredoxin-like copper-binding protein
MISRRHLPLALVTVVAMVSTGGSPGRRVPPRVPVITITAREFAFDAPDSIPAGPTTIRLVSRGRQQHFVQFVKLSGGHTSADYLRASLAAEATPWALSVGGVGTISAGGSATVTIDLKPGRYVLLCDISDTDGTPHFAKGMLRPLTVVEGAPAAAMPTPDVVLGLTDYAFTLSKPLSAATHVISVRNAGSQPHMALLWQLHQGKSVADVIRWMSTTGPAADPVTLMGGVPDLAPGQSVELVLDLVPGRYVLICLVDDIHDHKPHFAHGMVREVQVGKY